MEATSRSRQTRRANSTSSATGSTRDSGSTTPEVSDLRVYNRYLPRTRVQFEGGAGRLSGDLYFDAAGDVGRARSRWSAAACV